MNRVREYRKEDIPELVRLWAECFEGPERFAEKFFTMLPDFGSCVIMENEEGKVIAMASVIAGHELQFGGSIKKPVCGYIYGVAVEKACRGKGYGKEISKAAYELAKKRESMIVALNPASPELFGFYETSLGMHPVLYREKHSVPAGDVEMTMKLSTTEYNLMREEFLRGKTFLRLSFFATDFLRVLCEDFGGGLYASMSGICACTAEDGVCTVYEVLSQDPVATAASAAHALGCREAVYYLPSEHGEPFIASDSDKIPADTIWNITYE